MNNIFDSTRTNWTLDTALNVLKECQKQTIMNFRQLLFQIDFLK